ncbi:hypothetical protein NECID01_1268 [Nematocida sp. AWRm77]|nr:hypothetical protein NECID01_1268 [Nematocida sp. AWRm77]
MESQDKDKIILWLAHNEIGNMEEYVQILQTKTVPVHARTILWSLGMTKTWFKRVDRPLKFSYTVFLTCQKDALCPECFNKRQKEIQKRKEEEAKREKEKKKEEEAGPDSRKKNHSAKKEQAPEEKTASETKTDYSSNPQSPIDLKKTCLISSEEIDEILKNIDDSFKTEESVKKTRDGRLYMIQVVLHGLKETPDYQMLVQNEKVSEKSLTKILCMIVGCLSYFTSLETEVVFKFMFLFCTSLNGVFLSEDGQNITREEFKTMLLFIQNVATISKNKFVCLFDVLSTLNQESLVKFVRNVIKEKISVSSLKDSLFKKYSLPSALEIDQYRRDNPRSIPRIFMPYLVFQHQKTEKTLREIQCENARLRENIEVLLQDMQHLNTNHMIKILKQQLGKAEKTPDTSTAESSSEQK